MAHKRLTMEDEALITKCKEERKKLLAQAAQLSDANLAKKFEVSSTTIRRV